jgi:non-ribosomal peptide synthetase component F
LKNVEDLYPLSPMQESLLTHILGHGHSRVGFEQSTCVLRGPLDRRAFEAAWQGVVDRHAVLRTLVLTEGVARPLQVVRPQVSFEVVHVDWSEASPAEQDERLAALLEADRARGFDLLRPPLMRVHLCRVSSDRHRFVWSYSHLLLDGWCRGIVLKELFELYDAAARPGSGGSIGANGLTRAPRFRDYIAWLESRDPAAAERFWRQALGEFSGTTELALRPPAKAPVEVQPFVEGELSPTQSASLQKLGQDLGVTLGTLLHAAWAALLAVYGDTLDVVFGSTVSGRPSEVRDADAMLGLFINNLPIRVRLSPLSPLSAWLGDLQGFLADLRGFEHNSASQAQAWSGWPAGRRLFDTLLLVQNYPVGKVSAELAARELEVESFDFRLETSYPVTAMIAPSAGLMVRLYVDGRQVEIEAVAACRDTLLALLTALPAHRDSTVGAWLDCARASLAAVGETPMLPLDQARALTDRLGLPEGASIGWLPGGRFEARWRVLLAVVAGRQVPIEAADWVFLDHGVLDERAGSLAPRTSSAQPVRVWFGAAPPAGLRDRLLAGAKAAFWVATVAEARWLAVSRLESGRESFIRRSELLPGRTLTVLGADGRPGPVGALGRLAESDGGWSARWLDQDRCELIEGGAGARTDGSPALARLVAEAASWLGRQEGTLAAAVEAREGRVVGWRVSERDDLVAAELQRRLPVALRGLRCHEVGALPRASTGALDLARLAEVEVERETLEPSAELSPVEGMLASFCRELLPGVSLARTDNLFELGLQSIAATRLAARIRQAFEVELPLAELFLRPSLRDLAARIEEARRRALGRPEPPILPRSRDREVPLSFAQERLWFMDQLEPGNSAYNMPRALRCLGPLDFAALCAALSALVARHESLRTSLPLGKQGAAVQRIAPVSRFRLPVVDLSGLLEEAREVLALRLARYEAERPFDLARGPLMRGTRLLLAAEESVLLLDLHHVIGDGWSVEVLIREVRQLYGALALGQTPVLPPLPVQYPDFALWQRDWLQGAVLEEMLGYWRRTLAGWDDRLHLEPDRPRPPVPSFEGADHFVKLPRTIAERVRELSTRQGASVFMTLYTAFAVLLHRVSGHLDIAVGTDVAQRNRVEVEGLIGFFVNNLVLRLDLAGNPSFLEALHRAKERVLGAFAHQELPFDLLVRELGSRRQASRTPLFQVLFVLQNVPRSRLEVAGLRLEPLGIEGSTSKFDLALFLAEASDGLWAKWTYRKDLFEPATVARLAGQFGALLEGLLADPEAPITRPPLESEAERQTAALRSVEARDSKRASLRGLANRVAARRSEPLAVHDLGPFESEGFPWSVVAAGRDFEAVSWLEVEGGRLRDRLAEHGALWLRGFGARSGVELLAQLEMLLPGAQERALLSYADLPPRKGLILGQDEGFPLHHVEDAEGSPRWQVLWLEGAADEGGELVLVDTRPVARVVQASGSESVGVVVRARVGSEASGEAWIEERERPWLFEHPASGEPCLVVDQLELRPRPGLVRSRLVELLVVGGTDLPGSVRLAAGLIDTSMTVVPWRVGDVVILDNYSVASGRRPHRGEMNVRALSFGC